MNEDSLPPPRSKIKNSETLAPKPKLPPKPKTAAKSKPSTVKKIITDPPPPVVPLAATTTAPQVPIDPPPPPDVPETPPIEPPSEPTPEQPRISLDDKPKSKLKVILGVFIGILLLLTTGAVALAYNDYKTINPPQQVKTAIDALIITLPLPKTPRLIFGKAQSEWAQLKSAIVESELELATTASNFPIKRVRITMKGPVDLKTQEQTRSQFDIAGVVVMEGLQLSATGSMKQIHENLYFRITQLPAGFAFESIKDQWYLLNTAELKKEELQRNNAENTKKLQEVFEKYMAKFVTWTTIEKNDQRDVYTLIATPPKEEIDSFLFDLIDTLEPQQGTKLEKSIQKDNLREITKNIDKVEIRAKVNKKSYLVQENNILLTFSIDLPQNLFQNYGQVSLPTINKVPITLSIISKFSNFDEPVIVDIPENAKDLTESLGSLEDLEKEASSSGKTSLLDGKQNTLGTKDKKATPTPNLFENLFRNEEI